MLSLVVPIYKSEENLARLFVALEELPARLPGALEVVFVVDGSPDASEQIILARLSSLPFRSQLVSLSRNFGSFPAIAAGLERGAGDYFAVIAADLQEPPELIIQFAEALHNDEADIVFGARAGRSDPWLSELASSLFWGLYRRFVVKDIPRGGIDVFGCTRTVRDHLLRLREANTNLIALLFWLGFRRKFFSYVRRPRLEGRSAWTFAKKLQYSLNSIFNFTDLPIRFLLTAGLAGSGLALLAAIVVIAFRFLGLIDVAGYTAIIVTVVFFGGMTTFGLGLIGQYLWLSLQNTRNRPTFIIRSATSEEAEGGRETLQHDLTRLRGDEP